MQHKEILKLLEELQNNADEIPWYACICIVNESEQVNERVYLL